MSERVEGKGGVECVQARKDGAASGEVMVVSNSSLTSEQPVKASERSARGQEEEEASVILLLSTTPAHLSADEGGRMIHAGTQAPHAVSTCTTRRLTSLTPPHSDLLDTAQSSSSTTQASPG